MPYGPGLSSGPKPKVKKATKKPPAGPYRGESSNPAVRKRGRQDARRARERGETPLVPYTPPSGPGRKRAKKFARAERSAKKARKKALKILAETDLPAPQVENLRAKTLGEFPSKQLEETHPRAYKKAETEAHRHLAAHEGLKEDPLAEFIISTAATAGVGAAAGALGKAGSALVRGGGTAGAKALQRTAKATKATSERNLALHQSNQAAARASRRIRPPAKARYKAKARKKGRDLKTRYGKEGRKVARRQRATQVGLNAPLVSSTGGGVAAAGVIGADIAGHVTADPRKTIPATVELAPGMVVSTADLAAQIVKAGTTGDTEGLRKRIAEDVEFARELGEVMLSGDEDRVRSYVEKHGYVAPLILAPPALRAGTGVSRAVSTSRWSRPTPASPLPKKRLKKAVRIRGQRKQLAKDAARAQAEADSEIADAGLPIVRAYTGRGGRKGVRKRRKLRDKPVDRGDVLALAVEEGLRPGPRLAENFEQIARKWGDRPVFSDKREGGITGHDLIAYVRSDPGIWADKAFWRAVEAYRAQEPAVRRSQRVVDIEQAKTHGVQLAEDRPTPKARDEIPGVQSRQEVAAYISRGGEGGKRVRRLREVIRAAEGKSRELRAEVRHLEKQERARQRRGAGAPLALHERKRSQLGEVEADLRGLRGELVDTRRRHNEIALSLRDPAEHAALRREFANELEAVRSDRGLAEAAYVPHTDVGREGIPVTQPVTRAGKKLHTRAADEKSLAERGRVDYGLGVILEAGVQAPRIREHLHDFVNRAVHEGAVPIVGRDGQQKRVATREEFERGLTADQKKEVTLFPLGQFKQAVVDENVAEIERVIDGIGDEVDAVEGKPGHKYVALPKDYGAELKAQLTVPSSGLQKLQIGSRGLSRAILISPAWVEAQIVAESLQALHAINPLNPLNVYHFVQGYVRGQRRMDPEARRAFRANAGAMPGMGGGPREFFTASGRTHRGLADNFRKMERVLPLKRLIQAVRFDWGRALDRAKGGELRVIVAATKAHKDAVGFGMKLERLVKGQRQLSERLAKMTPAERLAWSVRSTPAKRKVEGYLDDVMGNWRAFSRKERAFAPAMIFYPFLRMSLQWPFYSFPKRHPVRAAIMYELAASHNEQLRELLGGPPSWFGEYATAIVYGEEYEGGALKVKASRIVPGANAIFEALSSGSGAAAGRIANPVVGYFNALFNGIDPLSGEKVDAEHLSREERAIARAGLTMSLLFNTPPPLRALDQLRGPKEATALPLVGPRRKSSSLGKLLEELYGTPEENALETLFVPFPVETVDHASDGAAMGRIFEIWRTSGSAAQDAVKSDETLTEREKFKKLGEMEARTDEADKELARLYKKYDIAYKAEENRRLDEWERLTYGKPPAPRKRSGNGIGGPIGGSTIGGPSTGGRIGGTLSGGPIGGGAAGGGPIGGSAR